MQEGRHENLGTAKNQLQICNSKRRFPKRARRRGHGGGGELDSPCPFGRAAGLVEEQDSPLVAAAVAIVGRAEDGDNVLVVAPGVPG